MTKMALVAGIACTTLAFASSAHADVQGLAPFVGQWGAHNHSVTISADGTGQYSGPDFKKCPSCSMADVPQSTANFVLTAVSGNAATGKVTAQSDSQDSNISVGDPVTATIKPGLQGKGQVLDLEMGATMNWTFCNNTSIGQCGA